MALDLNRYVVREIDKKQAKQIIVEHHYSHTWTSCQYALGLLKDGLTLGVAVYGWPIGRLAAASISPEVGDKDVLELTRLWIADSEGKNSESWFLGQTFDWIKKYVPSIKILLSYTDPTFGHCGTIYQATNWLYQGKNIRHDDYYLFKVGDECYHPKTIFDKYRTNNFERLKKEIPDIERIDMERKHRYIYILADKRTKKKILNTLKHPILPYVKFERKKSNQLIPHRQEDKSAKKASDIFFNFGE